MCCVLSFFTLIEPYFLQGMWVSDAACQYVNAWDRHLYLTLTRDLLLQQQSFINMLVVTSYRSIKIQEKREKATRIEVRMMPKIQEDQDVV